MAVRPFLHPFAPPTKETFINVVGGKGAMIYDDQGKGYVDGMASLWYMNVGHGHPRMAEAIGQQLNQLAAYHTFDPFTNPRAEELAELVAGLVPMDDPRVFFTCSGSEAVDTAMKVARIAQREAGNEQKHLIISRENAYHGTNYGGTSVQGISINREGFGPLVAGVINVPADNVEAMVQIFDERGDEVAAIITEPVQGAGGVFPPPEGYLDSLRLLCDQHGAFLILDEVICGFGRLGTWFGAEHFGVTPDMITFAKAVTSGYVPLGGVAMGPAVRKALESDPEFSLKHGYTYSGHPLAAAAGVAAIEILESEGLLARALHIGDRLRAGLQSLAADGSLAGVRGLGGMWAAVVAGDQDAEALRAEILRRGVIVRHLGQALVMCPPLVISDEEIDRIVDTMASVLAEA